MLVVQSKQNIYECEYKLNIKYFLYIFTKMNYAI